MLKRKYLFPNVIELNYQAGRRLGVNVYLIDGGSEFILIDIGFEDSLDTIVDLLRKMDFNLSNCKMIIATMQMRTTFRALPRLVNYLKPKLQRTPRVSSRLKQVMK